MKNTVQDFTLTGIKFLLIMLLAASCVPLKKQAYLQDIPKEDTTTFFTSKAKEYKIKPGDNLFIRIMSLDEKTSKIFNPGSGAIIQYSDPASVYLYSYSVNELGYIQLPLIGDMKASGLTIEEVKKQVQIYVDEYLKETTVVAKLANFQITLLGEVQAPGPHWVFTSNINIFEALALAGDITNVANGKNVKLIRATKNGSKIYTVDLTDKKLLESELYYLEPFDIVYVQPVKAKNFVFTQFPYTLIYATITTTLLIITYLN